MKTEWIFFDIGSTLVDETKAYEERFCAMLSGTGIPLEQFIALRTEFAKQGFDGNIKAVKFFGLNKTPWHSELEFPFPDTKSTLEKLKSRGYKLGIIANQGKGVTERLSSWGLLQYFDVIASSFDVGYSKPDRKIFDFAINKANCKPKNAVMVGDRLDNDIVPAKKLGMITVRINKGISSFQPVKSNEEIPDYNIGNICDLLDIFT